MTFLMLCINGPRTGEMAEVECTRFEVGMLVVVDDRTSYVILDGPIAQALQASQESSVVLAVRAKLIPNESEAPCLN